MVSEFYSLLSLLLVLFTTIVTFFHLCHSSRNSVLYCTLPQCIVRLYCTVLYIFAMNVVMVSFMVMVMVTYCTVQA